MYVIKYTKIRKIQVREDEIEIETCTFSSSADGFVFPKDVHPILRGPLLYRVHKPTAESTQAFLASVLADNQRYKPSLNSVILVIFQHFL